MTAALRPSRLRPADIARTSAAGLRTRPLQVVLSATGIAIGIAAMLAVVGISASSGADLDRELDRLGTDLLTAAPGTALTGERASLPVESVAMVARIGPVRSVSATAKLPVAAYRNDRIPTAQTSSIAVLAAKLDLLATVGARVRTGAWLTLATAAYPAVVLGSAAAVRLGIDGVGVRVWLGGQWFGVAGILDPVVLAGELDTSVLLGWAAAGRWLGFTGHPGTIYARAAEEHIEAVRSVLAATANPAHPEQVRVSRPSDALAARL
ncbi:MAG TPA: ABC transporter permease, partial [Pilimelia sp.]|nr:ABC transporter permease [Pilimelia sp.]